MVRGDIETQVSGTTVVIWPVAPPATNEVNGRVNAKSLGSGAHASRDLYAKMMREDNPKFGCLKEADIKKGLKIDKSTRRNGRALKSQPSTLTKERGCTTQQRGTFESLMIGKHRGSLYLWENGSVINWIARSDGYPDPSQALLAAQGVFAAADAWNEVLGPNRVSFKYVENFSDACFQLRYGGESAEVLASAFFPDDYETPLNDLKVFSVQFTSQWKDSVANTMAHELGHILGLRHEFAQEYQSRLEGSEDEAAGLESVIYGSKNPLSVMAYNDYPEIQDSDKRDICNAYDQLQHGGEFHGKSQLDWVTKKVFRIQPDN